jgi:hypothetical protein
MVKSNPKKLSEGQTVPCSKYSTAFIFTILTIGVEYAIFSIERTKYLKKDMS